MNRIFFPKNSYEVESGSFAIFSAEVVKEIENCESLNDMFGYSSIKLKGKVCKIEPDVIYSVVCRLESSHPRFGDTYAIDIIYRKVDLSDTKKQRLFLENIIAPTLVKALFEKYEDVITLLETKDMESLTSVKGIKDAKARKIIQAYEDTRDYSHMYVELGQYNLSKKLIEKLIKYYNSPNTVVDICKNDPYRLVEVNGIGFGKADEIAQKLGLATNSPSRVKAFMLHFLDNCGENGKSYVHYSELMDMLYNTLGFIEESVVNSVAKGLVETKSVFISEDGQLIGLDRYYKLETEIFHELMRLHKAEKSLIKTPDNWEEKVRELEEDQGFAFTKEQFHTIRLGFDSNVLAITGSGGTGKTSALNGVTTALSSYLVSACALSGKASVRITEATGLEASTIHRLLGFQDGKFSHGKDNPLDTDAVIIDESTMVNGTIFLALLRAIPTGAKLFMLGDWQQLTPIGNCQVFADILNSTVIPISILTEIHRQAKKSGIILASIDVANQTQLFDSKFEGNLKLGELQDMELDIYKNAEGLADKTIEHFMKHYNRTHDVIETQIVAPTKTRGELSTYNLNIRVQELINPIQEGDAYFETKVDNKDAYKYRIKTGDKVINVKNNYNAKDLDGNKVVIMNGNVGLVVEVGKGKCVVSFTGIGEVVFKGKAMQSLWLGYANTVHKLQGSGYDTVIFAIDYSAYVLLNAELVYTGITRAKKYGVLIGLNSAIRLAIQQREVKNKQTYLRWLLKGESTKTKIN